MNDLPDHQVPFGPLDLSLGDLKAFIEATTSEALKTPETTQAETSSSAAVEQKWRLFEKRLTYAWNFFDFHAKQRMTMFNYFLILVGFVISAYATLLKDGYCLASTFLAGVGAALALMFQFLDRRNEELVHVAESVLVSLESDVLFSGYKRNIMWPQRRRWLGRMEERPTIRQLGILLRQAADVEEADGVAGKKLGKSKYEHGMWLPRFQFSILLIFVVLAIFPWWHEITAFLSHHLHKFWGQ